jgi:8-oxo-dGDP phosphatase
MTPTPDPQKSHASGFERLDSRVTYRNPWMSVREDRIRRPDGSEGVYGVIDKPDFALIIPFERDGFHLIEQFRYPIGHRSWEFPQGTWPEGRDGDTEELARAELAQETGIRAGRLEHLGRFSPAPGLTGQGCQTFLATELVHAGAPRREAEEQDMTQRWIARDEFEEMIRRGEITDGATISAYALLVLRSPQTT